MEIAKGISNSYYKSLDLSNPSSQDWEIAAKIFEKRFFYRYIEPVDVLIKSEEHLPNSEKKFGFTVTAIDCLLIETLACFYCGLNETPKGQNKTIYIRFLTDPQTSLSSHFNSTSAKLFYEHIRCGILHQSETKKTSLIKAWGPIIKVENGGVVVNRTKLHDILKKEFQSYISKIGDPININLREKFRDKMSFICR